MMLILLEVVSNLLIRKYKPVVVCVTGSVGKTSTKDAVAASLSTTFRVRKTPRNLNNEYGVPISIIGTFKSKDGFWALVNIFLSGVGQFFYAPNFPEILVIEVGAGKIGEVRRISKWLKPDILAITNLPNKPSHLGVFGSKEKILEEKKFLVDTMDKKGSLVIDSSSENMDLFIKDFKGNIIAYDGAKLIDSCDYTLLYHKDKEIFEPIGFKFKLALGSELSQELEFRGFIGVQNIRAMIIASLISKELGCSLKDIVDGLRTYIPSPGRLRLIRGRVDHVTIIDDSFNSSPIAVENSLKTFLSIEKSDSQRTIAVLGDMLNLGIESAAIHKTTATKEVSKVDVLITVGDVSSVWQAYNQNAYGLNKHFRNSTNAANYIKTIQKSGDLILFKGGHLIRLEKAIKILGQCDEDALVRQEGYWQVPEFELYNIGADEK